MIKSILTALLFSTSAMIVTTSATLAQDATDWLSKERFQLRGRLIAVLADGDGHVEGTSLATDVDVKVNSGSTALRANDVSLNPFIVGAGVSYCF